MRMKRTGGITNRHQFQCATLHTLLNPLSCFRTMYMDAAKASSTNATQSRRRHRSPSPVCSSSSPEDTTRGRSPRSKKYRREHHRTTDYNPLASLFPNGTNTKVSEPKDDRDKLTIQFWKASQFDSKNVPAPKPYNNTYQPSSAKTRFASDR